MTPAFIGGLGPWELGIILLIVLIFFGAGKLPQVFESFGQGVKKFRDAQKETPVDVSRAERPDQIEEAAELDVDLVGEAEKKHIADG